jgi:hypothetical protein
MAHAKERWNVIPLTLAIRSLLADEGAERSLLAGLRGKQSKGQDNPKYLHAPELTANFKLP